jgi:molybdenum cofactor cytidylyltransferase
MPDAGQSAAVILAAGSASRFGSAKILAPLDGRPLLAHVIDAAWASGLREAVIVLGPDADSDAAASLPGLGRARLVRNPHPEDGLSSSLRLGLAALGPGIEAAVILLGDQPLVRPDVVTALLSADVPIGRSIVVPRYATDDAANPALLLRAAWPLTDTLTGDRGMGPVIAAHPELVVEVPVPGANPDVDTPADLALVAWASRVRANAAQVERVREVGDGDFYASTTHFFRADPRRPDSDDAVLAELRVIARPGERWLDIGAGAGRYALPLALAVGPAGEVIAVDPSPSMLAALREGMAEHGIDNVRPIEGRWPLVHPGGRRSPGDVTGHSVAADVAFIAHVGYDVEEIGPFLDAMEAAAGRLCIAVLTERAPASIAEPFWPSTHGEPRIPLPALPEFVELLRARGRTPTVTIVERGERTFSDRDAALTLLRRQTWVAPDGPKDLRLQALLDERLVEQPDGSFGLRDAPELVVGVVTWEPR